MFIFNQEYIETLISFKKTRNVFIAYEIKTYPNFTNNIIQENNLYHLSTYYIDKREDLYLNNGGSTKMLKEQEKIFIHHIINYMQKKDQQIIC